MRPAARHATTESAKKAGRGVASSVPTTSTGWVKLRGPRYSQSLAVGVALLRCFSRERPVLGIADLSDLLGLNRSTTHRYVSTLARRGCLEQTRGRKYQLSRRVVDLGLAGMQCSGLSELSRPWLAWLRRKTGFTASVAVLDEHEVVYVAWLPSRLRGQAAAATDMRAGWRAPAHASAAGKAILAFMPASSILPAGAQLERLTAATIISRGRLLSELAGVWELGYALSDGELADCVRSVAVPVPRAGQLVAAVELTVFAHARKVDEMRAWVDLIQRAAENIATPGTVEQRSPGQ